MLQLYKQQVFIWKWMDGWKLVNNNYKLQLIFKFSCNLIRLYANHDSISLYIFYMFNDNVFHLKGIVLNYLVTTGL